jgi:phosphoribosylformimino-5-aminoimidazole carboxamide ribotide isomerase
MKTIDLLPAVDIKSGKAARLQQGKLESSINYGQPAQVIQEFLAAGAQWIHLVDLDAAFNLGENRSLITDLIAGSKVKFQLSGGITGQDSLEFALSTKVSRINLATSALLDLDWIGKSISKVNAIDPKCLSISLDVKGEALIARGTGDNLGNLFEMIKKLDQFGCNRYVITDIDGDGALTGPNLNLLSKIKEITKSELIASGGVASIDDLTKLRALELSGVILGKALYTGLVDLQEAISACYK